MIHLKIHADGEMPSHANNSEGVVATSARMATQFWQEEIALKALFHDDIAYGERFYNYL